MVHLLLVVYLAHRNVRQDNRIETTERDSTLSGTAVSNRAALKRRTSVRATRPHFLSRFSGNYPSTRSSLVRLVSGGPLGVRSFDVHAAAALRLVSRARCQVHCSLLALTRTGGSGFGLCPPCDTPVISSVARPAGGPEGRGLTEWRVPPAVPEAGPGRGRGRGGVAAVKPPACPRAGVGPGLGMQQAARTEHATLADNSSIYNTQ